jgi:hypothetical protein
MRRAPGWVACGLLLGVAACADVWGFKDLTLGDGGAQDATTVSDAPNPGSEGGEDAEADSGQGADSGDGAADAADAADARSEIGDGGPIADTGARDAGDDGASAACMSICMTCCDSTNKCVKTSTVSACGMNGSACMVCPSCGLGSTTCCGTTSGQCGCAAAGLLCNKN